MKGGGGGRNSEPQIKPPAEINDDAG